MNGSHRGRHLFGRLAVVVCLTLSGIAVTAVPANAGFYKCAQSHGALGTHTCLEVNGSSLKVNDIYIDHSHISPTVAFCQYTGKFWGTLLHGSKWTKQPAKTSGCTIAGFYVYMTINRSFENGTKVYGQAYHDGSWAPGAPAGTIKK